MDHIKKKTFKGKSPERYRDILKCSPTVICRTRHIYPAHSSAATLPHTYHERNYKNGAIRWACFTLTPIIFLCRSSSNMHCAPEAWVSLSQRLIVLCISIYLCAFLLPTRAAVGVKKWVAVNKPGVREFYFRKKFRGPWILFPKKNSGVREFYSRKKN